MLEGASDESPYVTGSGQPARIQLHAEEQYCHSIPVILIPLPVTLRETWQRSAASDQPAVTVWTVRILRCQELERFSLMCGKEAVRQPLLVEQSVDLFGNLHGRCFHRQKRDSTAHLKWLG